MIAEIAVHDSGVTYHVIITQDSIFIRALPDGDELNFDRASNPVVFEDGIWVLDGLIFLIVEYRRYVAGG